MSSTSIITLDGFSQRADSFRFDVLDTDLALIGTADIEASGVSIENNINRSIKRQINNLRISALDAGDINPLTDRLRPMMILQDGSEWPLGVFVFSDTSTIPLTGTKGFVEATLLDQGIALDFGVNRTYGYKAGGSISGAITRLLNAAGVTNYSIDPSTSLFHDPVSWPAGTSLLEIINDLCELASYYTLFFDNTGAAQIISVPDLATTDATLRYGSTEPGEQRVISGTVVLSDDLITAPNRYIVINTSLTDKAIVGSWDIPSTAPNSKENIGRVITSVTDKQGVDSNNEAISVAKAIGQADFNTFSWATFDAAPDPRHDTFDVVAWEGVNYREQSWTLNFGGDHNHELRRIFGEPTFVDVV